MRHLSLFGALLSLSVACHKSLKDEYELSEIRPGCEGSFSQEKALIGKDEVGDGEDNDCDGVVDEGYCGDGIVTGAEQCDGEYWCSGGGRKRDDHPAKSSQGGR